MANIKASVQVQIAAARRAIQNYESNIAQFESGALVPDIGELTANRLLLQRKRKQLRKLEGRNAIMNVARQNLVAL